MKTLLILGGFGFLGSNILKFLDSHDNEYKVIVFDKNLKHQNHLDFNCIQKSYAGDFLDESVIRKIFQENKIDLVIHSISSTVPASSENIELDIQTNLIPTIQLLNIMKEFNVYDIVFISSGGAIYGESTKSKSELSEAHPISSYGIVKLAIEKFLFLFSKQYNLRPLILRPSNLYGLYHYSKKQGVINIALRKALDGEDFLVWGSGNGKKDYLYVEDFCKILFNLVDKNVYNEIINIGSGELLSVNKIISSIKKLIPNFRWQYGEACISDIDEVALDITKLIGYIGDYKFKNFSYVLTEIYNWHREIK